MYRHLHSDGEVVAVGVVRLGTVLAEHERVAGREVAHVALKRDAEGAVHAQVARVGVPHCAVADEGGGVGGVLGEVEMRRVVAELASLKEKLLTLNTILRACWADVTLTLTV